MLSHAYVGLGFGVARLESFIINTLSYTYPLFTYVNVLLFMKLHPYICYEYVRYLFQDKKKYFLIGLRSLGTRKQHHFLSVTFSHKMHCQFVHASTLFTLGSMLNILRMFYECDINSKVQDLAFGHTPRLEGKTPFTRGTTAVCVSAPQDLLKTSRFISSSH